MEKLTMQELSDWLMTDYYITKKKASALKGFMRTYRIEGRDKMDSKTFLDRAKDNVVDLLGEQEKPLKMKLILEVEFYKKKSLTIPYFHSEIETITDSVYVSKVYEKMREAILEKLATFQNMGSGWIFRRVVALDISLDKYIPLRGKSYIDLPLKLKKKNAVINILNKDSQCFKWAVTVSIFTPDKHPDRVSMILKENAKKLDWRGLEFPVPLDKISIFEKNNPKYAVNVYGWKESVYPLRISGNEDREQTINLLLISNSTTHHYCWIKSMSRLLSAQITNHNGKRYFCERCLISFKTEVSLEKHSEYCESHQSIKITLPKKGTTLSFKNYNRSMRVPFVVYADFECFTEPMNNSGEHAEDESYTEKYQTHRPSGFCYGIKSFDDLFKPKIVRYTATEEDDDIGKLFVERLEKDIRKLANIKAKDILMSEENRIEYENAMDCFICNQKLKEDKVRDHDHLTGKYRGAAHAVCNLNYRIPKHIPVIFHNLAGYDAHLFIKSLGFSEGKIDCIPNNEEKYISFKKEIVVGSWIKDGKTILIKRELRFIDSFKFMSSGLDKLVGNLKKEQFRNMSKFFTGEKLDLLLRKGVYPYDYVNRLSKLDETALPSKEEFFSKLNDIDISDADYLHAQKVWRVFKMNTMRDYHNLYLLSDVLLLMDAFEAFRDVCMENYTLDPCWYYTAPGLSWDAMLKMTEIKLELLNDVDMLLMVEKGIRGGVSMITKRYAKANNKYMKDYRKDEKSIFIKYLDANNLYGWAMSEPLPTDGFKWMSKDKLRHWHRYPCILEVDLEYPEKLRDLHDEYPLAPEHLTLNKVEKLVPTTRNRTKYIVHHHTLRLYESLGMKITKIHRGITFNESDWLKKYINLNTELRTAAKNDFEKDFFKLMNNSVFGKTMENIRNRQDIKLVTTEKQAAKLISQPNYYRRTIFSEHLCAIHMRKTELVFNKPVYLGMAILDLSKALMYDFHYNYFKKKFRNSSALLFTDTDSLMYEVETEDFYKDIKDDIDSRFDTSAYPKDHPIGTWANKKVIGMMKDETAAEGEITEFVGLRSKLYAYKIEDKEEKKCKGIKKSVVKKDLEFDDYKNCLFSGVKVMRKMNVIRSYKHQLFSETVNKVALSREDDKRNILADQIHTHSI